MLKRDLEGDEVEAEAEADRGREALNFPKEQVELAYKLLPSFLSETATLNHQRVASRFFCLQIVASFLVRLLNFSIWDTLTNFTFPFERKVAPFSDDV